MKRSLFWIVLLVSALATVGCGARAPTMFSEAPMEAPAGDYYFEEAEMAPEPLADRTVGNAATGSSLDEVPERMIIYNGGLDLVVKDTSAAQESVEQLVSELGGFVLSSDSYRYGEGLVSINITLRIPAEKFFDAMGGLRAMALEVTRDSISSQDVTQEYVDLESRLRALEIKAEKLAELMDNAEDTEAVLAVYQELSYTQEEIEQVKGRMQYLERSAAMATITVSLTPDELLQPVEIAGWRPQGTVKQAIEAMIKTYQFLVDALIWIILFVLPVLAGCGLAVFLAIKALQRIFKRRAPRQKR
ncbi:MAG: DUF4349 domain-containing protein, partial [Anaerolineae bacterium]|nr:DUF4349 domain-containing protein [Anaerolineae bacterium]